MSEILFKSRIIFWKSEEGKLIIDENLTLGIDKSSTSGSGNFSFWILHCSLFLFSNLRVKVF